MVPVEDGSESRGMDGFSLVSVGLSLLVRVCKKFLSVCGGCVAQAASAASGSNLVGW